MSGFMTVFVIFVAVVIYCFGLGMGVLFAVKSCRRIDKAETYEDITRREG